MKQFTILFMCFCLIFSCAVTTPLAFTEINELYDDNAVIELNIPMAKGNTVQSNAVNKVIESHIANTLVFMEEPSDTIKLSSAIKSFDSEYKSFKEGFSESAMVWDASFDGEVMYQSSELISIAINSYVNSGGAHGNSNIVFFNFDSSGNLLKFDDLFSNKEGLITVVESYFNKETEGSSVNYFFDEPFHLPENFGFNVEGVIFFYNVYEIASYADGITEFTIPYSELEPFLKLY